MATVAALIALVTAFFVVRPAPTPGPAMRDFEAYHAAGRTAARGADPYGRAIWDDERTTPGVDPTRDEVLPFVGPAAELPLWRLLGALPFTPATRVWGAILALAMCTVIFGSLALAGAPRDVGALVGATLLAGSFGPLTSDVALGQVALVAAAGVVIALIALRGGAWYAAAGGALLAALQPNLAIVLIARVRERLTWIAFGVALAIFVALTFANGGMEGFARYLSLLRDHGVAERQTVIQIAPEGIAFGFGASPALAATIRFGALAIALGLLALAFRRVRDPGDRTALAICALPFVLPFFHEHDFVLTIVPALLCAVRARGRTLAFAAFATTLCGVDWLGLGQRPSGEFQSALLALVTGIAFALVAGLRAPALAGLATPLLVGIVSVAAAAHPVPIWPDGLPPHWQATPGAPIAAVWADEQRVAGLDAAQPVWAMLRLWSLAGSALLGAAVYLTALKYPRS